jgi:hypothetical protein
MEKLSIKKGYDQVQRQHLESVRTQIMSVLEINSRTQWNSYLKGKVEPKLSKAVAIADIFTKVGVTNIYE